MAEENNGVQGQQQGSDADKNGITFTDEQQAHVDSLIADRLSRADKANESKLQKALADARAKWDEEQKEAADIANMSDKQRQKHEQEKTNEALNKAQAEADKVDVVPTRAIMSTKALMALRKNPHVVADIFGSNNGRTVLQSDLDAFMQANGLPVLRAYRGKYADTDSKGKRTVSNYVADNQFAMFADGTVGETVYGVTPEESRAIADGSVQASQVGNIFTEMFDETNDPIRTIIKASTMVVPTLAQADNIFQATVL